MCSPVAEAVNAVQRFNGLISAKRIDGGTAALQLRARWYAPLRPSGDVMCMMGTLVSELLGR